MVMETSKLFFKVGIIYFLLSGLPVNVTFSKNCSKFKIIFPAVGCSCQAALTILTVTDLVALDTWLNAKAALLNYTHSLLVITSITACIQIGHLYANRRTISTMMMRVESLMQKYDTQPKRSIMSYVNSTILVVLNIFYLTVMLGSLDLQFSIFGVTVKAFIMTMLSVCKEVTYLAIQHNILLMMMAIGELTSLLDCLVCEESTDICRNNWLEKLEEGMAGCSNPRSPNANDIVPAPLQTDEKNRITRGQSQDGIRYISGIKQVRCMMLKSYYIPLVILTACLTFYSPALIWFPFPIGRIRQKVLGLLLIACTVTVFLVSTAHNVWYGNRMTTLKIIARRKLYICKEKNDRKSLHRFVLSADDTYPDSFCVFYEYEASILSIVLDFILLVGSAFTMI